MFFEQHAIVPNIGAAYFWLCLVKGGRELQQHALDDWMEEGQRSLNLLDKHMARNRFAAGERYSVADIALYAYTHLAEQCDFDLRPFPALRNWFARVAAEPQHVAMDHRPEQLTVAAE
jgi:glutathione S-transferase